MILNKVQKVLQCRKEGAKRSNHILPSALQPKEKQKKDLDAFQRREQQLAEVYYKNKPLCSLALQPNNPFDS